MGVLLLRPPLRPPVGQGHGVGAVGVEVQFKGDPRPTQRRRVSLVYRDR